MKTQLRVTLCGLTLAGLICIHAAARAEGPSGGSGGEVCHTNDLHPDWRLTSINVRAKSWVDRIELTFDTGGPEDKIARCGGDGGDPQTVLTINPNEYIVRLTGRYGNYIDFFYVEVAGNPKGPKGRRFGNPSSTASGTFDYQAPDGMYIAGFLVKSHTYLDAIGVFYRKLPNKTP